MSQDPRFRHYFVYTTRGPGNFLSSGMHRSFRTKPMNPLILLVPIMLALTWARLIRPGRNKLEGSRIVTVPIPVLARIRMHLVPGALALAGTLTLALMDVVPWWVLLFPAFSDLLLVLLPARYTLTNIGVRLGWTEFRRWTEFAAVRRAPGGARLIGVQRGRGMHIWLSGSRGDDEFIHFLKQTVRGAYKGDATVIPFPDQQRGRSSVVDRDQISTGVSAYTSDQRLS